jgi:hypothetical protein
VDNFIQYFEQPSPDLFLPTYEKIFIAIFNSGVMPDIWLVGKIKPIYKNKGNPLDSKKFCPITFKVFVYGKGVQNASLLIVIIIK